MRVVFALRSVEIKPLFRRFVVSFSQEKKHFSLSLLFFLSFKSFSFSFFFLWLFATAGSESLERQAGKQKQEATKSQQEDGSGCLVCLVSRES